MLPGGVTAAVQAQRLGTGHAVMSAREFLQSRKTADVLVTLGDAPFLFPQVIQGAYRLHREQGNAVTVVSAQVEDPAADLMLAGRLKQGDTLRISVREGQLLVQSAQGEPEQAGRP